jgi:hypothetical protein
MFDKPNIALIERRLVQLRTLPHGAAAFGSARVALVAPDTITIGELTIVEDGITYDAYRAVTREPHAPDDVRIATGYTLSELLARVYAHTARLEAEAALRAQTDFEATLAPAEEEVGP